MKFSYLLLEPNRVDEVGGAMKKKKAVRSPVLDSRAGIPSLARNFQGLAIHETPSESPNVSKIFVDNFLLDNHEEYMNIPATARLANANKAYMPNNHNTSRFMTQFSRYNYWDCWNKSFSFRWPK